MGKPARRRRTKKRCTKTKRMRVSSRLLCLPRELITEIIARVASSSFSSFLTTNCKDFYQLPEQEEAYVYRRVCLDEFPIAAWRNVEEHSQFLDKCYQKGNPEALYREGVSQYFGSARSYIAMDNLKEAANLGHLGARYALGIILIFCGGELKQEGIALLGDMKKSKILRKGVKDCRESLKRIIKTIWKSPSIPKAIPSCCTMQHQKKRSGWYVAEFHEDEDEITCEACTADVETASICKLL